MFRRTAVIAWMAAIFGVAVISAGGYSAGAAVHKKLKRCPKGQTARQGHKCFCPRTHRCHPTGHETTTGTTTTTGTPTTGTTTTPAKAALTITYSSGEAFAGLEYSLDCGPPSGTLADPAAACAEIAAHPGMVFEGSYGDHSCPGGEPYVGVKGEYEGQAVNVWFSYCAYGGGTEPNWLKLLPTNAQENEVSIDHGIGPVALGEPRASIEALGGNDPTGTAGGLYVFDPWSGISESCAKGINVGGAQSKQDFAIRYGSDDRVETVMGNSNGLTIDGHKVWSLLVRCPHSPEVEAVSRSEGPLAGWVSVTCGEHEAIADHPFSEGQTDQATTLIIPAGEADQWPLVIVTSNPTSACEDATRLNAEYGALLN